MAKSKFFRVAVEGQTTDGRVIERNWLEEMAASYNPATYAARVNMEHIRGFSADMPFRAYGDVLALSVDTVELELAGKTEKKLALFAQIDATDDLVALNKQRQKLFTSCEIAPNFADTGKAYLVGLAVTDSPASLGTEMLAFAAGQGEANPLAGRKQDAANLFTAADPLALELEPETPSADAGDVKGLVQLATEFFAKLTSSSSPAPVVEPAPAAPAVVVPAAAPAVDLSSLQPIVEQLATAAESATTAATAAADQVAALSTRVDALSAKLDATPAPGTPSRPLASGGNGYARTDC